MGNTYYDLQLQAFLEDVLRITGFSLFAILLAVIFCNTIIGVLCTRLAKEKGYKGYFLLGFFLGIWGLLYVAFLPDQKMRKYLKMCSMKMQIMDERLDLVEDRLDRGK